MGETTTPKPPKPTLGVSGIAGALLRMWEAEEYGWCVVAGKALRYVTFESMYRSARRIPFIHD